MVARALTSAPSLRTETLFVIGGTLETDAISKAVYGFNTTSKSWSRFPDLQKARACHRAVFASAENAIVVVGGSRTWPAAGFGECEMLQLDDANSNVCAANATQAPNKAWASLPSLRNPRSCHGLTYFMSCVYACAGMMDPERVRSHYDPYGVAQFDLTKDCEYLDLHGVTDGMTDGWKKFPELNFPRFGLQLMVISLISGTGGSPRHFLLAIGGRGPDPRIEYSIEAIELTSTGTPKKASWDVLDTFLESPRIDFAAAVVENGESLAATSDDGVAGAESVDIVILGGNRVTRDERTDSSRNWEVLRVRLAEDSETAAGAAALETTVLPGGRLPTSRVGCRATVLRNLMEGKSYLAVAGGFRAWGETQKSYDGPIDKSVSLMELAEGDGTGAETVGASVGFVKSLPGLDELQQLPLKLRQPSTCVSSSVDRSFDLMGA